MISVFNTLVAHLYARLAQQCLLQLISHRLQCRKIFKPVW